MNFGCGRAMLASALVEHANRRKVDASLRFEHASQGITFHLPT